MPSIAAIAETAALLGEPARTAMLAALLDGRALTAGELAATAGVTPQTASLHLGRLTEAGLLAVERQGRHRYHRLASPAVAQLLEGLMQVADASPTRRPPRRTGPADEALRRARTCYDHLAGRLGVALTDALVARGQLELEADGGALTPAGEAFLDRLGLPAPSAAARRGRRFCRPCLDWSERRPHLAGALGAALCAHCFGQGWLRHLPDSRAVAVTPAGQLALARQFGVETQAL